MVYTSKKGNSMKFNKIALLGLMFVMIPSACTAYDQYSINVGTIIAMPLVYGALLMRKIHQKRLQNNQHVQDFKKTLTKSQLERFEQLYQSYDTWKGSYISALIAGISASYVCGTVEQHRKIYDYDIKQFVFDKEDSYGFISSLIFGSTCVLAGLWQTEHLEEVNEERFEQAKIMLQAEIQEQQDVLLKSSKSVAKK